MCPFPTQKPGIVDGEQSTCKGSIMAKNKDSKKSAAKNVVKVSPRKRHDLSYTQNRELSWLRFDGRVLDEAGKQVYSVRMNEVVSMTPQTLKALAMVLGRVCQNYEAQYGPIGNGIPKDKVQ